MTSRGRCWCSRVGPAVVAGAVMALWGLALGLALGGGP